MASFSDEWVTIRGRDKMSGQETLIKVKKGTSMEQVFEMYVEQTKIDPAKAKFVNADHHILHPQLSASHLSGGEAEADATTVKATCRTSGDVTYLKVVKGMEMSDVFNAYSQQRGLDTDKVNFVDPGENSIHERATPESIISGAACGKPASRRAAPANDNAEHVR